MSKRASLSRDAILGANDRRIETVEIPEWGGTVRVRSLSGAERDALDLFWTSQTGATSPGNVRARFAAACIVDEEGNRVFGDDDVDALGAKDGAALDRVFDVILRLSRLREADIKALEKN